MDTTARPRLDHYLRYRHGYEAAFLLAYMALNSIVSSTLVMIQVRRQSLPLEDWQVYAAAWTSDVVAFPLLVLVILFNRRFPLLWGRLRFHLPLHFLASVVYCVLHVTGMVALRKVAYASHGQVYDVGNVLTNYAIEYLADGRAYFTFLVVITAYRFIILRLQGEARVLEPPDVGLPVEPVELPQRFLIRKLGKEFLIAAQDIEWLGAQGNYVNLHVRGRAYPLRSTMAAIEARLDPQKFARVHRSHIVNLDHLVEIEPLDTGDARLKLRDGTTIPCSRTYRQALRGKQGAGDAGQSPGR